VKFRSLRARLIAGTVGWTLGLLFAGMLVILVILHFHPRMALFLHNSFLFFMGAVLIGAGVSVIRRGLSPFTTLRERLAAVRAGTIPRLDGEYPSEVEPLVADLNTLLDERDRRVASAVAKAGDLAHGLKTPLAILLQDIERAEASGQRELAASMREQVQRMRRQIESHLAQARATARGALGARASVGDAAQAIARAMERLYAERALAITIDVGSDVTVRVPAEDLEEMIGNLVDNACKWAHSRVTVTATAAGDRIVVDVDDDGAGIDASMQEAVLGRGVRADQRAPGSGLGLAIVRDLADAYGGTIALERSPAGGLRARLTLPAVSGGAD
jgi:signal transduction histidine kinase